MLKKYLECGKITGTHGIRGDIRVTPWCDGPEFLCDFKELYINETKDKLKVGFSKVHKNIVIMHICGVDTIEEAERLIGKVVFIDREMANLSDDEYFIQDILGLSVFDQDSGKFYGKVTDIFKTGANDVYQVTSSDNKNYLIPVIDEVVKEINLKDENIQIVPMKGLFDDEN